MTELTIGGWNRTEFSKDNVQISTSIEMNMNLFP